MFYIVITVLLLLLAVGIIWGGKGAHVMGPGMFILFAMDAARWYIAALLAVSAFVTFCL